MHVRHPFDLGGFYYCFNAVMNMLSVLVSAVIYSLCMPASTVGLVAAGLNSTERNSSDYYGALSHSVATNFSANETLANHTTANSTHISLSFHKIDDLPLFVSVTTLIAVWAISAAGLLLTIKRKYVRTFVSTQIGCEYACNIFLEHEGNDAMRINILSHNERQWLSIRDRVRQWVRNGYALWEQLRPAWFNESLQARIPDDLMPVQVVVQLNAQAPSGRRQTVAGMGLLRRAALNAGSTLPPESAADPAVVVNVPSPEAAPSALVQRGKSNADGAEQSPSDRRHGRIESTAATSAQDRAELAAGLDDRVKVVDLEAESQL